MIVQTLLLPFSLLVFIIPSSSSNIKSFCLPQSCWAVSGGLSGGCQAVFRKLPCFDWAIWAIMYCSSSKGWFWSLYHNLGICLHPGNYKYDNEHKRFHYSWFNEWKQIPRSWQWFQDYISIKIYLVFQKPLGALSNILPS